MAAGIRPTTCGPMTAPSLACESTSPRSSEREKALRDCMRQIDLFRHVLDELPVAAFIKADDLTHRVCQQGLDRHYRDFQGRGDRPHRPRAFRRRKRRKVYSRDDTEVVVTGERQGDRGASHASRRHAAAADDAARAGWWPSTGRCIWSAPAPTSPTSRRARRAQESLRENEVFRSLIDNVPVAIYAKRPDLKLFYVNKGWSDLTGITADEAVGKTDTEIFGPEGEAFMEGDRAVLARRKHAGDRGDRDGGRTAACATRSPARARWPRTDGSLYLIGSTTDITELKQREQELQRGAAQAPCSPTAPSRNSWPI